LIQGKDGKGQFYGEGTLKEEGIFCIGLLSNIIVNAALHLHLHELPMEISLDDEINLSPYSITRKQASKPI
jgi:hypothetical protein